MPPGKGELLGVDLGSVTPDTACPARVALGPLHSLSSLSVLRGLRGKVFGDTCRSHSAPPGFAFTGAKDVQRSQNPTVIDLTATWKSPPSIPGLGAEPHEKSLRG